MVSALFTSPAPYSPLSRPFLSASDQSFISSGEAREAITAFMVFQVVAMSPPLLFFFPFHLQIYREGLQELGEDLEGGGCGG